METPHGAIFEIKMNDIEYIPFYGEYKMTNEDQKASKKKAKPVDREIETTVETVAEAVQEAEVEQLAPINTSVASDPPEPGTVNIASTPNAPNIVRRGFTTIQMARAFLNRIEDPENYLIVEVREANGIMLDGPILAHYVAHKNEE